MLACLLASGCASTIPLFDVAYKGSVPNVSSIVIRIQCELNDIVGRNSTELEKLVSLKQDVIVGVELSLSVTDDGQLAPTATWMSGPFTLATGIKLEQSREQNFTESLLFSMTELYRAGPNGPECDEPPDTNLSGTLGLRQIYDMALTSGPNLGWNKTGDTGVFGGSVTFTVDKEITSTGPTWKLTHFVGPGSLLSAYNKNVDKLTFGFVKGAKADKAEAKRLTQQVIDSVKLNQISGSLQILSTNLR